MTITSETVRRAGVIADKIEDGTLFRAGIFTRAVLAETVRAVLEELQRLQAERLTLIDQQGQISIKNVDLQAEVERLRMGAGAPAAQAYRMLVPGVDIIRADDEFLSDDTTTWEPAGQCIFVGMAHLHAFKPGRRRISGAEDGTTAAG